MANAVVWFIFLLGIAHIVFGLVRFKKPVAAACSAPLFVAPVQIAIGYGLLPLG